MKSFALYSIIIFSSIFLAATCKKGKASGDETCIDSSKINQMAGCTREYRPVCGCDGKTYSNECVAKNAGLTNWVLGECDSCIDRNKIDPKRGCEKIYKPVCGCDEVTYSNICEAEKAGVVKWREGACE